MAGQQQAISRYPEISGAYRSLLFEVAFVFQLINQQHALPAG